MSEQGLRCLDYAVLKAIDELRKLMVVFKPVCKRQSYLEVNSEWRRPIASMLTSFTYKLLYPTDMMRFVIS